MLQKNLTVIDLHGLPFQVCLSQVQSSIIFEKFEEYDFLKNL